MWIRNYIIRDWAGISGCEMMAACRLRAAVIAPDQEHQIEAEAAPTIIDHVGGAVAHGEMPMDGGKLLAGEARGQGGWEAFEKARYRCG